MNELKTNALYVTKPFDIEIRQVDIPEPEYDELQIQTKAIGICAWDSLLYQGKEAPSEPPYRIGHEGVGVVIKKGDGVKGFEVGDKIFVGTGGDEMMAEHFNVKYDCACEIPHDEENFVAWVAEPTVCVVNLLNRTDIQPGDDVVLVGAGYMGLLTLQGLKNGSQAGEVTVFEINSERRKIAEEYFPGNVYDPYSEEGKQVIDNIKARLGAKIVIDFSTSDEGFALSCELTQDLEGKLIIGAWHHDPVPVDLGRWHKTGLHVMNLSPHSNYRFKDVTVQTGKLVEKGVYEPIKFVTHTAKFGDIDAMHELFRKSIDKTDGYIKGVFVME